MGPEGEPSFVIGVVDDLLVRARPLRTEVGAEGAGLERVGVDGAGDPEQEYHNARPSHEHPERQQDEGQQGGDQEQEGAGQHSQKYREDSPLFWTGRFFTASRPIPRRRRWRRQS